MNGHLLLPLLGTPGLGFLFWSLLLGGPACLPSAEDGEPTKAGLFYSSRSWRLVFSFETRGRAGIDSPTSLRRPPVT
jgi:hypothetical protein